MSYHNKKKERRALLRLSIQIIYALLFLGLFGFEFKKNK